MVGVDSNEVVFHLVRRAQAPVSRTVDQPTVWQGSAIQEHRREQSDSGKQQQQSGMASTKKQQQTVCSCGFSVVEFEYIDLHRKYLQLVLLCKCVIHVLAKKGKFEPVLLCIKYLKAILRLTWDFNA
jgi:hypothetical protein